MKKVTIEMLEQLGACRVGINIVRGNSLDGLPIDQVIQWAIDNHERNPDYLRYANWLIVRCMTYKQYVSYACFAARQVLRIYEDENPSDLRPRQAIEAAEKCIKRASEKNKDAAAAAAAVYAAAADAAAAAAAVYAAAAAAAAAAYAAAYAAADAAAAAAYAAADAAAVYAAAAAAAAAVYAAAYAAADAAAAAYAVALRIKILKNGIKLLRGADHETI